MQASMKLEIHAVRRSRFTTSTCKEKGFPATGDPAAPNEVLAASPLLFASPEYNWSGRAAQERRMCRAFSPALQQQAAALFSCTKGQSAAPTGQ